MALTSDLGVGLHLLALTSDLGVGFQLLQNIRALPERERVVVVSNSTKCLDVIQVG